MARNCYITTSSVIYIFFSTISFCSLTASDDIRPKNKKIKNHLELFHMMNSFNPIMLNQVKHPKQKEFCHCGLHHSDQYTITKFKLTGSFFKTPQMPSNIFLLLYSPIRIPSVHSSPIITC